jgi:alkanesulfonate monooxygenase SsuD/methylene tetrahydromethanopterin reductase-like flavin-dependent oxidoreductase (luciferase family)
MTQDIIEMAREAGLCYQVGVFPDWIDAGPSKEEIIAFANLVAAKATEEALAQTQEPVAWFSPSGNLYKTRFHATANGEQVVTPLYTSPPQRTWVGLTDEEIAKEFYKFEAAGAWYQFARAIEAKLKEKNT